MSVTSGQRLGPYEIIAPIGAGFILAKPSADFA